MPLSKKTFVNFFSLAIFASFSATNAEESDLFFFAILISFSKEDAEIKVLELLSSII